LRLFEQRLRDQRRAVAQAVDGPALHEVQVALAAFVSEPGALAFDKDRLWPAGDGDEGVSGVAHGVGCVVDDRQFGAAEAWPP
jgi:hypothetical protein